MSTYKLSNLIRARFPLIYITTFEEIIVEMDSKIKEILNKKEISYNLEIIKNKIQNAEEKKENI